MTVKLVMRDRTYEVRGGMTLRDSLLHANLNPESVLGVRNGELITDEEILPDGEVIRLVAVVSGGSRA